MVVIQDSLKQMSLVRLTKPDKYKQYRGNANN